MLVAMWPATASSVLFHLPAIRYLLTSRSNLANVSYSVFKRPSRLDEKGKRDGKTQDQRAQAVTAPATVCVSLHPFATDRYL